MPWAAAPAGFDGAEPDAVDHRSVGLQANDDAGDRLADRDGKLVIRCLAHHRTIDWLRLTRTRCWARSWHWSLMLQPNWPPRLSHLTIRLRWNSPPRQRRRSWPRRPRTTTHASLRSPSFATDDTSADRIER